jgi:hypothetical protein
MERERRRVVALLRPGRIFFLAQGKQTRPLPQRRIEQVSARRGLPGGTFQGFPHFLDGWMLKYPGQREPDTKRCLDLRQEADRHERVASQFKEIIVDADCVHPQHL